MNRIEVSNVSLSNALGKIEPCASSRGSLPILANVLMELREGRLWLTMTDLDVRATVPIQVISGSTFPALTVGFSALSKLLAGDKGYHSVCLRPLDNSLVVSIPGWGIAAKLPTMSAVEFPAPLLSESGQMSHFPATTLARICHKVAPFIADDTERSILNVVHVQMSDWHARFGAADGFKLSILETNCEDGVECDLSVPAKVFSSMECFHGPATLAVGSGRGKGEKAVSFTFEDGATLSAVCVEGKYPDLDTVIPPEPLSKFKVNARDWLCGLEAITLPGVKSNDGVYHEWNSRGLDVVTRQGEQIALCHIPTEAVEEAEDNLSVRFILCKGYLETVLQAAGGDVMVALRASAQQKLVTTPLLFIQTGWQAALMPMVCNTGEVPDEELRSLSAELRGQANV